VPGAPREKDYSEETSRTIDAEVRSIVESSYERARSIITVRKDAIMKIAEILLRKEVLDGEELKLLLRQFGGAQA
jgi:cell division protease FtsH